MITLCFTYDTVSEKSAENGDFCESGFYEHGGWTYSIESTGMEYDRPKWERPGDLKAFLAECQSMGMVWDGGTDWLYTVDPDRNYSSGEETNYAAHIDGCTPSTKRRILRLFKYPR